MTRRKIDPDQLREMVAAGATFLEVQARQAWHRLRLPVTKGGAV